MRILNHQLTVRLLLTALVLWGPLLLYAQDYKFNHIGSEKGLSQSVVNCMLQDRSGFMWFGTQEGLNRYDGYNFRVYKRIPGDSTSLSNSYIYALCEDRNGRIWIGTNGGGINVFDPRTETFRHYANMQGKNSSLSNNTVRSIAEDPQGRIWIGTDAGLNLYQPATNDFRCFRNNPNDPYSLPASSIYSIAFDARGQIWLGTYGSGICRLDETNGKFFNYIITESKLQQYYPAEVIMDLAARNKPNQVRSLLMYDAGKMWVGTDGGGLAVFDLVTNDYLNVFYSKELGHNRIFSMTDDGEGNIWMALYEKGLDVFNRKTGQFQQYVPDERDQFSLRSPSTKYIYCDKGRNIWVGTNGEGIDVYFKSTSTIAHVRRSERPGVGDNTLKSNLTFSALEDVEGQLWMGTYGGGVSRLNRSTGQYTHYPQLSTAGNNSVLSLLQTRDSSIWVGTWGDGVNRYNPRTGKIVAFSSRDKLKSGTILCLTEEPATGAVWVGTLKGGIYRIDPLTNTFTHFTKDSSGLVSDDINCLFVDRSGLLWIGTRAGGMMCRDPKTGKFTTLQHDEKDIRTLSSNMVYCITEDQQGAIWISTANGINRYDKISKTFTTWYERDGLPSDNIYAVVSDLSGKLWLSHNKGITLFDPAASGNDMFRNFGPGSGVQPGEFNQGAYLRTRKGEIIFGGQSGLNIIDPAQMNRPGTPPAVFITSYKRFGKEVVFADSMITLRRRIEVSWRDNYFQFEVAALDYVDPARNLYQYKLDGFDDEWSPVTNNRFISYTNLPGGHYTLQVRACNSSGVWNEIGLSLDIIVKPPFWRTTWFYILCALVAVLAVFGYIRLRTRAIRNEKRVLEEKVAERTQELAQKNEDITSSIEYARRIQFAILPELENITKAFPENFIFYRPKDIVSGDFYWFAQRDGCNIFVVADCTGHGVPGALMSVIGHNLLNQLVLEKGITDPAVILRELNIGVRAALKQDQGSEQDTTDGMDMVVCSFGQQELLFAGALRPLIVVKADGTLRKFDGDRYSIGGTQDTRERSYTSNRLTLEKGDMLYFFTDGYADQFGGPADKKFMVKRLLQLLTELHHLPIHEQKLRLETEFDNWRQQTQQVDDVLVAGIRMA